MTREERFALAREVVWWVVIAAMSLIDGVAFFINISIVLAKNDPLTRAVVVLGCSAVAVALPTLVGSGAAQRRHATGGSAALLSVASSTWVGLAAVMVVVRVTSDGIGVDPSGSKLGQAGNDALAAPGANLIVAVLLLLVYVTTGLLAFSHAFAAENRRILDAAKQRRDEVWKQLQGDPSSSDSPRSADE